MKGIDTVLKPNSIKKSLNFMMWTFWRVEFTVVKFEFQANLGQEDNLKSQLLNKNLKIPAKIR